MGNKRRRLLNERRRIRKRKKTGQWKGRRKKRRE